MKMMVVVGSMLAATHVPSVLPSEMAQLDGAVGAYVGVAESGACEINLAPVDSGETYLTVRTNTLESWPAINLNTLKAIGKNRYVTDDDGSRIGGDACGDFGGMIGYKQVLIVEPGSGAGTGSIKVVETFRCVFEGLKKTVIERTCTVR